MSQQEKIRLALVYGGQSGEHEISLLSAGSVLKAIDLDSYEVTLLGIDKQGLWYQSSLTPVYQVDLKQWLFDEALPVLSDKIQGTQLAASLFCNIDVVLPIVHGPLYEDGCLQGFLELLGLPYVGSGVLGSAIVMDKDIAKRLVSLEGVATAAHRVVRSEMSEEQIRATCQQAVVEFDFPLFVKPACMGSSVGIHKVGSLDALIEAVEDAFLYDEKVLIESFIDGQEVELAVLGSPMSAKVSVAGEIVMANQADFYSYKAKYQDKTAAQLNVPANLNPQQQALLEQQAGSVFRALECYGMARADFFIHKKTGKVYFNELNTLPGFTAISMYPRLWQYSGLGYTALLNKLIELAIKRAEKKKNILRDIK